MGVAEGSHEQPWTRDYHRDAVRVYAASLPAWYQSRMGELFRQGLDAMADGTIPARLAADWVIVTEYMASASMAIAEHHASSRAGARELDPKLLAELDGSGSPPLVIRFDELAALTTCEGASRLERAAVAVQQHMDAPLPLDLDSSERHMLTRLKAGAAIADLAAEMGHSERSMYRVLARLWDRLGVPDREEGVRRVVQEGLLD